MTGGRTIRTRYSTHAQAAYLSSDGQGTTQPAAGRREGVLNFSWN